MQYINTGMNLKLCNSSIKLYLRVNNIRPSTHYSGIKMYQTAFGLFRCQDVSYSNRLIRCHDVQGSKRFIRFQNIPGSISLILESRYTRQHSPYFGIKMYQAAKTLFSVKSIRQHCFIRCHDIPGSIRLIRVSRNTRQHCLIRVSRNTRQHCLIRVSRYTRQHTLY